MATITAVKSFIVQAPVERSQEKKNLTRGQIFSQEAFLRQSGVISFENASVIKK
jgi:hypothetical protein